MATQKIVNITTGANWVQPTEPLLIERDQGNVWIDNSDPVNHYMKTWDGANWVVNGLLKTTLTVPTVPPPPAPPIPPLSTYGIAGYTVSSYSGMVVDKLTPSTETTAALGSFGLNGNTQNSCGLADLSNGWNVGSHNFLNTRKISFSSSTLSIILSSPVVQRSGGGTGLSNVPGGRGYFEGGEMPAIHHANIDRFTFSTQTFSASTQTLIEMRTGGGDVQSTTNGYAMGGSAYYGQSFPRNNVHKLIFSNEAVSLITSLLPITHFAGPSLSGSVNGYQFSGWTGSNFWQYQTTEIDRLTYSTETTASIAQVVSPTASHGSSVNGRQKAFICGGAGQGRAIKRFSFSTETLTAISALLTTASYGYYGRLGEDLN